ncbi:unnamed protein product [Diplocarpon coronariae]
MPLQLSLATEADLPAIARSQMAAFHPIDPIHALMYPSPTPVPESVISQIVTRHIASWRSKPTGSTWLIVTDPSQPKDAQGRDLVIAAAKWIFLAEDEEEDEERWSAPEITWAAQPQEGEQWDVPGAHDVEYIAWIMQQFYADRRLHVRGAGAVLDLCFTHPSFQKMGAGKLLVGWGTRKADELGVPAWVEGSVFGRGLYQKFGFGEGGGVLERVRLGPWGADGDEGRGVAVRRAGSEEGWRAEWSDKGYLGGGWWFMGRPGKGAVLEMH